MTTRELHVVDVMGANTEPDDVHVAGMRRRAIRKECAAVWRPAKLEDALPSFEAFNAQARPRGRFAFRSSTKRRTEVLKRRRCAGLRRRQSRRKSLSASYVGTTCRCPQTGSRLGLQTMLLCYHTACSLRRQHGQAPRPGLLPNPRSAAGLPGARQGALSAAFQRALPGLFPAVAPVSQWPDISPPRPGQRDSCTSALRCIDRRTTRRKPLGFSPRRRGGCAWVLPAVSLHFQVLAPAREGLGGDLSPSQTNRISGCPGGGVPPVKVRTN